MQQKDNQESKSAPMCDVNGCNRRAINGPMCLHHWLHLTRKERLRLTKLSGEAYTDACAAAVATINGGAS